MRKAVLVSLDALFDKDLAFLKPDGGLRRQLDAGTSCDQVKTVFPSLTYPAHTTLITGCDPRLTGIGHNQPFQPDKEKAQRAWYWDRSCVRVDTLFDAVRRSGGTSSSILWPVTGKNRNIRWALPEVLALPGENQALKMMSYGSPLWILRMEMKYGHLRTGIGEPGLSDFATAVMLDVIRSRQPDLTAVHLVDLDEMRHLHGVFSREAMEAVARHEDRVAALEETLRTVKGLEDALLIVVSDHGQEDITRTVELRSLLREHGLDKVILPQSNGMTAYFFSVTDDENALSGAYRYLDEHREQFGISRMYNAVDLCAMHCVQGPVFAAEGAPGVVFSDLLEPFKREAATHGFGPSGSAVNCLFSVSGKGIRSGARLPSMPMRDVAPTIAELMGISLLDAEGVSHAFEFLAK